jgi:hypothetical protein
VTDGLADRFDPAELRRRVLDAWAAAPSRFREDANAEEDYALGGYRDRVVVELAQNAADAAARAGVPGRLRLTLRDGILTAANTGAPLDAAGVEALSTLRASSKREAGAAGSVGGTVGRFGVGFAAVVAVSDAPRIRSAADPVQADMVQADPGQADPGQANAVRVNTVQWSRDATRDLVRGIPALADELAARGGHVPVLRLPFARPDQAARLPDGFQTVVELPLRDQGAVSLVTRLLAETGPALLLALPALAHVEITVEDETRLLTAVHDGALSVITEDGVPSTWRVAGADGVLDPALLADRPAEERARTSWSVRWAVPADAAGQVAGRLPDGVSPVVHAPTPTDEPLSLPALLLASFPLSPDRRHIAPGPLTSFLVERAADAYAGLLPVLPAGPGLLDLVPGPVGRSELDARVGDAIVARLPEVPFLPAVTPAGGDRDAPVGDAGPEAGQDSPGEEQHAPDGDGPHLPGRVRPRDAVLLGGGPPGLAEFLAAALPNLCDGPRRHPAWSVLGVRRMPLAELADVLASLGREPAWWHRLYAALAGAQPSDVGPPELGELGALPVPLADGRLVRGPRGLLLPGPGLAHAGELAVLGLRVVHPEAAHPLLARLGAMEGTPRGALEDPATRAAVAASYDRATEAYYDDDGPGRVADAVLGLVAAVRAEPGDYPWLADLALPGEDGDWYPAGELLRPGSPLAEIVAGDAPFGIIGSGFAARHDVSTLEAAGVLSTFGLLRAQDVPLDESAADLDLDGAGEWAADTRDRLRQPAGLPPVAVEVTAVRDLDLVAADRWPLALELLTGPPLRAALTEPARVRLADGRHEDVPSYTAWWLRRHVRLGGRRPAELRAPDADPLLDGLYDAIGPALVPDPVIARALGVRSSLAALLAEPGGADDLLARLADPARPVTRPQLRALWSALAAAGELAPDDVTPPDRVRAVLGTGLVVTDAADVLVLDAPDLWPLTAARPLVIAPYQHAARLADLLDLPLASDEVPGAVKEAGDLRPVPGALLDVLPGAPVTYREHDALAADGTDVPWRYTDGELHAATTEGLAHGLAWAAGRWAARHLLASLLTDPDDAARLLAETDLGE